MKATFDLPADLVRQLKLKALKDGRKLKDAAAEALRAGLAASAGRSADQAPVVTKDRKTGLPVIQCRRAPVPGEELTPERVAEILAAQEAEWARDPG